jgi:hypothetical protein
LARKKNTFSAAKEIKAIARERIGSVPAEKTILPKASRKKPKHKKPPGEEP